MATQITDTSDKDFDVHVTNNPKPVLLDFWAPWCGPCKNVAPLLEAAVAEHPGIDIVKLDIDQNPATTTKFNVRGIPALFIMRNGKVIAQRVGQLSKGQLDAFIKAHI